MKRIVYNYRTKLFSVDESPEDDQQDHEPTQEELEEQWNREKAQKDVANAINLSVGQLSDVMHGMPLREGVRPITELEQAEHLDPANRRHYAMETHGGTNGWSANPDEYLKWFRNKYPSYQVPNEMILYPNGRQEPHYNPNL